MSERCRHHELPVLVAGGDRKGGPDEMPIRRGLAAKRGRSVKLWSYTAVMNGEPSRTRTPPN